MKKQYGITLIALVITIIILLILASISINLLLGDNGILRVTDQAKLQTEIAQEKEIIQLALGDIQLDKAGELKFNGEELQKAINANAGNKKATVTENGKDLYLVTYEKSKREYEVSSKGNIENAVPKVQDSTVGSITQKEGEEDTYLIQSIEDLVILAKTVNGEEGYTQNSYEGKTFEIQCDLNFNSRNSYQDADSTTFGDINKNSKEESLLTELTTERGNIPIGKYSAPFKGTIEGNNHTITGLYMNTQNDRNTYVGFIGLGENVTIQNLNLNDVNITAGNYAAAFVGEINSGNFTAYNLHCNGTIQGNTDTGSVLGIYYENNNLGEINLQNCINEANIQINGSGSVGMIGKIEKSNGITVDNCQNIGNITGGSSSTSGLIGSLDKTPTVTISNSSNKGTIQSKGSSGGLIASVGYNVSSIEITKCFNTGNVKGTSTYVGGLVGQFCNSKTTINNSYNSGNIEGTTYVGGITGRTTKTCSVTNCYNSGNITGKGLLAGIVGAYASGITDGLTINQCYNTGLITSDSNYVGGILGQDENGGHAHITNCYNEGKVSASSICGGICGYGPKEIKNCYNIREIKGSSNNVGGILGEANNNTTIENVYNSGPVSNNNSFNLGGIVGSSGNATIDNVFNLGEIDSTNTDYSGAIAGYLTSTITSGYYLKGTAQSGVGTKYSDKAVNVEEKETTDEMKTILNEQLASIEGWKQDPEGEYPILDF